MGYDMLEMIKNQYYVHFSFQKKKKMGCVPLQSDQRVSNHSSMLG